MSCFRFQSLCWCIYGITCKNVNSIYLEVVEAVCVYIGWAVRLIIQLTFTHLGFAFYHSQPTHSGMGLNITLVFVIAYCIP